MAPGAAFDRRLVAPLVLGAALNPINSSIIAVSLVPISAALDAPASQTAWLISSLYLATAIGQPVAGRLVDLYGTRPLYLAGAVLIALGGALGTVAPSLPVLVAARVLIGLGTCAGYPAALSLIRSEGRRTGVDRPQGMLTLLAVSSQTVAVLGPPLGGLLIGVGGWRATFAVNVPLAAASIVLGWLFLPRGRPDAPGGDEQSDRGGLDLVGVGLFTTALVALVLFAVEPGQWWQLAVSAGAAAAFTTWELRAAAPFIDLRSLAGNRPLLASYGRVLLAQCTGYLFFFGFTQWLQDGRGLSASEAGLLLSPMFAVAIVVSVVTGRRRAVRGKLLVGAVVQGLVAGALLTLDAGSDRWALIALTVTAGVPLGLVALANQNAVYVQSDPARSGSAAGLLRTFTYVGGITASAAIALAYPQAADTEGLHRLGLGMIGLSAALLALTAADRSLRRVPAP